MDALSCEEIMSTSAVVPPSAPNNSLLDSQITSTPISENGTLTVEVLRGSLSSLGHTPCGQLAYTRCVLEHLSLTGVEALKNYRCLQHISLDHNRLTDLSPLRELPGLLHLSARHNELDSRVFKDLGGSANFLENLFVDHNNITSLDGLERFQYLLNFSATHNHIGTLRRQDFFGMTGLTRLNLASNEIEEVEVDTFSSSPYVRSINLNKNRIRNVHFVAFTTSNLDTLRLSHNNIAVLGVTLAACQVLATLDLSDNQLSSMDDLRGITPVVMLRFLSLQGNALDQSSKGDVGVSTTTTAKKHPEEGQVAPPPAACTEIVMDDIDYHEPTAQADADDVEAAGGLPPTEVGSEKAVDFAALSLPSTYGVVRRVLTANRTATIPWTVNRTEEMKRLPLCVQLHLQILCLFPQLVELNGTLVGSEDVVRAQFFFRQGQ